MASDDDLVGGRNNGAEDTTRIVGQKPEDDPGVDFHGTEILEVVPLANPTDRTPDGPVDGIVGAGWNGPVGMPTNPTPFDPLGRGIGVVGKGGIHLGTGVAGFGSAAAPQGLGGIGVRGVGGRADEHVTPPGMGVVGQGGRRELSSNTGRLPHGAGVVGIGGGAGRGLPPDAETGSVGVFGLGGTGEEHHMHPMAPTLGAEFPGSGVMGRGGVMEGGSPGGISGPGIVGVAGWVAPPSPKEALGVGVFGTGKPGVKGVGVGGPGVFGQSDRDDAVLGDGRGPAPYFAPSPPRAGCRGLTLRGHGVAGFVGHGDPARNAGDLGRIDPNAVGVYGEAAAIPTEREGFFTYRGFAGMFRGPVRIEGSLTVAGGKSAVVPHPDGSRRALFCLESPESWFEDFGEAELRQGEARVDLDADFAAVVDAASGYHVFLTPYGDSHGLYVSERKASRFAVREQGGGRSSLRFSYRVVGRRRDVPRDRMPQVEPPSTQVASPEGGTKATR